METIIYKEAVDALEVTKAETTITELNRVDVENNIQSLGWEIARLEAQLADYKAKKTYQEGLLAQFPVKVVAEPIAEK